MWKVHVGTRSFEDSDLKAQPAERRRECAFRLNDRAFFEKGLFGEWEMYECFRFSVDRRQCVFYVCRSVAF